MSIPDSASDGNLGQPTNGVQSGLAGIVAGVVSGFSSMAVGAGGGTELVGGAATWFSPSNIPVFNAAGLFSADLIAPATLDAVGAYFLERSHPYSVMILDGLVPGAAQRLDDLGFVQVDFMPAMWLDDLQIALEQGESPQSPVEVKRVTENLERATFRSVLLQVFEMPPGEVDVILRDNAFDMPNIRHYIARAEGSTVGTATLVTGGEIAGIWNVGTLMQHRRRGVAAQMMRHALSEAQEAGCLSSMLLASRQGTPLYERLGYSTLSALRVFVPTGAGKQQ